MTIKDFFATTNLNRSFLIGYYGGTNFGDELLLEVLQNVLARQKVGQLKVYYKDPSLFPIYHKNFGFDLVNGTQPSAVIRAVTSSSNVVVGGGGHWGVDSNASTLMLGLLLFFARYLLGKQVYLLGVGFYATANRYGRVSAWLSAKAAHLILVRDDESKAHFSRWSRRVHQDTDLAFLLTTLDHRSYQTEIRAVEQAFPVQGPSLWVTNRRVRHATDAYLDAISNLIASAPSIPVFLCAYEARQYDPDGVAFFEDLAHRHPSVKMSDFVFNPVAIYFYLKRHRHQLSVISPQFHGQLVAHLAGVPFLPVAYDNKNVQLYRALGITHYLSFSQLTPADLLAFAKGGEAGR